MQMSLKHSQAHGEEAVEEFRTLLNDNIQELNRVVDEEGPEHLQQLLKHAEMTMSEHQQATPWQMAQRLGLAMAPVVLLPVSSQVRVRCARDGRSDLRDFLWDCPKKRNWIDWNIQREPTGSWNNGTVERECGCCYHFWGTCFMNGTSPCMAVHPKSLRQVKGCVGFRVGPGLRLERDWLRLMAWGSTHNELHWDDRSDDWMLQTLKECRLSMILFLFAQRLFAGVKQAHFKTTVKILHPGRHPTFNVRCLFVVRNDGSPDEEMRRDCCTLGTFESIWYCSL